MVQFHTAFLSNYGKRIDTVLERSIGIGNKMCRYAGCNNRLYHGKPPRGESFRMEPGAHDVTSQELCFSALRNFKNPCTATRLLFNLYNNSTGSGNESRIYDIANMKLDKPRPEEKENKRW